MSNMRNLFWNALVLVLLSGLIVSGCGEMHRDTSSEVSAQRQGLEQQDDDGGETLPGHRFDGSPVPLPVEPGDDDSEDETTESSELGDQSMVMISHPEDYRGSDDGVAVYVVNHLEAPPETPDGG